MRAGRDGRGPPRFRLDITTERGVTVIGVHGEVDLEEAGTLLVAFQTSRTPVLVDLRPCEFLGGSGLVALLNGRMELQTRKQRFVVLCEPETGIVARLFQAVGARQILPLYDDREEALAAAAAADQRSGADRRA